MNLNELYHLRKDFTIIGLTGRISSGCSQVANRLTSENYDFEFPSNINVHSLTDPEEIKINISNNYLSKNWKSFKIINYENVFLLHVLFESLKKTNATEAFCSILFQNGETTEIGKKVSFINRFDPTIDNQLVTKINILFQRYEGFLAKLKSDIEPFDDIHTFLDDKKNTEYCHLPFEVFNQFSYEFYEGLHKYDVTKKQD